jgi:hypothetical protein
LGILFSNRAQADKWMQKPNGAFDGQAAIDYLCKGSITQLIEMRRYIDAQRG